MMWAYLLFVAFVLITLVPMGNMMTVSIDDTTKVDQIYQAVSITVLGYNNE